MKIPSLAAQIAAAARFPIDAAEYLADYVLSGNYTGGELHCGAGEYGYQTIYGVIYPCNGRWYIVSGYMLADSRFCLIDAGNGQSAKSLRGCFHFERRCDYFYTLTPEFIPDLPPVVPALPEVLPVLPDAVPDFPDSAPDFPDAYPDLPDMPPIEYPDPVPEYSDDEPGTVYVLMLDTPLGSSRHSARFYCGWAKHLNSRIYYHSIGQGAAFTRAAVERGIPFKVVFTMPGTRRDERRIKNWKGLARFLQARGVDLTGLAGAA